MIKRVTLVKSEAEEKGSFPAFAGRDLLVSIALVWTRIHHEEGMRTAEHRMGTREGSLATGGVDSSALLRCLIALVISWIYKIHINATPYKSVYLK